MLIVDDILLLPLHGILWVVRQVHDAAQQEIASETESITNQLSNLYMMLETSRISEGEFESQEKILLDRLSQIEEGQAEGVRDEDRAGQQADKLARSR